MVGDRPGKCDGMEEDLLRNWERDMQQLDVRDGCLGVGDYDVANYPDEVEETDADADVDANAIVFLFALKMLKRCASVEYRLGARTRDGERASFIARAPRALNIS